LDVMKVFNFFLRLPLASSSSDSIGPGLTETPDLLIYVHVDQLTRPNHQNNIPQNR